MEEMLKSQVLHIRIKKTTTQYFQLWTGGETKQLLFVKWKSDVFAVHFSPLCQ